MLRSVSSQCRLGRDMCSSVPTTTDAYFTVIHKLQIWMKRIWCHKNHDIRLQCHFMYFHCDTCTLILTQMCMWICFDCVGGFMIASKTSPSYFRFWVGPHFVGFLSEMSGYWNVYHLARSIHRGLFQRAAPYYLGTIVHGPSSCQ